MTQEHVTAGKLALEVMRISLQIILATADDSCPAEGEGEFAPTGGAAGDNAAQAAAPDSLQGMQGMQGTAETPQHPSTATSTTAGNSSHSASTTFAATTGNDSATGNYTADERQWGFSARGPLMLGEGTRRGLQGPGKRAVELVQELAWRRVLGPPAVGLGMAAAVEKALGSADVAKVFPHFISSNKSNLI
jgi:hypothetical protein